ncbi:MAG: hypothetical protein HY825_18845 [Acidobacteria bacterium]|nr:hypothetical protein [Acidobacteriota bacterium]
MKTGRTLLALAALVLTASATVADDKPTPGTTRPGRTPTAFAPPSTGFDLKAVDIGTTGSPSYFPIFTFMNVGTKATTKTVRFVMRFQGGDAMWGEVPPLGAGRRNVQTMSGSWGGFARYGLELEIFVDCDNLIKEDDEHNNVYKETLRDPRKLQQTPIPHP